MENTSSITIALDGHSSTGKSTLAKQLAMALEYTYVDSGAMYRCATLCAMRAGLLENVDHLNISAISKVVEDCTIGFERADGKSRAILNGEDVEDEIRSMSVSTKVSYVSAISAVRKNLVQQQQAMGRNGGVVMDGRDIGTVVFPNAELKVFMTASPEVRAKRRYDELIAKGDKVDLDEVAKNLKERDEIDSNRQDSPLKPASDAVILDNSNLTPSEQFAIVMEWAKEKIELK